MRSLRFVSCFLLCACWKPAYEETPATELPFNPRSGELVEGWFVETVDMPLLCPDGQPNRLTIVRPDDSEAATATAILFHSGAFNYVKERNGFNEAFRDDESLTADWALRRAHTTIGVFVDNVTDDSPTGAMAQALVEQNVQLVLPGNCWGDLWHNRDADGYRNDAEAEGFTRLGAEAAKWTYDLVTQLGFGLDFGLEISDLLVRDRIYGVGFGEGGRAIGELENMGRHFDGAILDSTPDDLEFFLNDADNYAEINDGLFAIFGEEGPVNEASVGSVARLPDRIAYYYSSIDPILPSGVHGVAIETLVGDPAFRVRDTNEERHNLTSSNLDFAQETVQHMMDLAPTPDP